MSTQVFNKEFSNSNDTTLTFTEIRSTEQIRIFIPKSFYHDISLNKRSNFIIYEINTVSIKCACTHCLNYVWERIGTV